MNSIFNKQLDAQFIDEDEINPVHEDAMKFSKSLANSYIKDHLMLEDGLTSAHLMTLGCARLQWVLEQHRPQISGIFTEDEILNLLDCNQERLFITDGFSSIPSDLCDHYGIEPHNYLSSRLLNLIDKLHSLNSMQFFTLADALEQTWHRGMRDEQTPKEFLQTLGIELV
jgi:hypothetical protein